MIAWAIWTNRNESRHGGAKKTSQGLLQWSLDYLAEYQACSLEPASSKTTVAVNWTPSSPNRYKINVDGAVFKAQKAARVGVLIRDANGSLIVSGLWLPWGPLKLRQKL